MFNRIRLAIIAGITAAAVLALPVILIHTPENCRALILKDAAKHQRFMDNVAHYQVPVTFHQALGGK